ncbi:hypothetical protein [Moraxella lacunata]
MRFFSFFIANTKVQHALVMQNNLENWLFLLTSLYKIIGAITFALCDIKL